VRMTGCGASSPSSPQWAASCCWHHWQSFLPKESGGSWRPHWMQLAMATTNIKIISSSPESATVWRCGGQVHFVCAESAVAVRASSLRLRSGQQFPHSVRDFGCGLPLRSRPQGASTSLRLKNGCVRMTSTSWLERMSVDGLGFSRHVIHQQILAERVGSREVGFSAAHLGYLLDELH